MKRSKKKATFFRPGFTRSQQEAFEQIGAGNSTAARCHPKSVKFLLDHGMIEYVGMKTLGRDCLGLIQVPEYEVPLPIHMEWCKWCSENVVGGKPITP